MDTIKIFSEDTIKFFAEFINRFFNTTTTIKTTSAEPNKKTLNVYSGRYWYALVFVDDKPTEAQVYKYDIDNERYKEIATYTDMFEFLARL